MNRIVHLLKRIQLRQILAAFMAGVLLVISTACGAGKVEAQTPPNSSGYRQDVPAGLEAVPGKRNPRPEVPEKAETNSFKGSSMNEFSDVDPRASDTRQGKAKALVENAERNINQKGANLPDKVTRSYREGTPLGERVRNLGEDIGSSAEDLKEGVSKGTKQGVENIKDNTLDATRDVKKGTARTIDANTPDTDDLARKTKQATTNAAENTKAAGKGAQNKLEQAAQGARDALNKTGDAINNAVD